MTGFLDRERAAELMARAGLDALILSEPEAFRYATGENPGPAALFRRAGPAFAIVPRETNLPLGVVIGDFSAGPFRGRSDVALNEHPVWIESVAIDPAANGPLEARIEAGLAGLGRPQGYRRPATFALGLAAASLRALLADLGLSRSTIGFDLDFVPAADLTALETLLPELSIRQGSPVLDRLRAVKSPAEIALLELGIRCSEAGLAHMQAKAGLGSSSADLIGLFRDGVASVPTGGHTIVTAEYLALGALPARRGAVAGSGDPLKCDMVCLVDGYGADMSRNYVFGTPSQDVARLHAIAEAGFEAGLAMLRPGRTTGDVARAVETELARQGLPSWRRGHFGHGVGFSVFSEQWPYIAAGTDDAIEPGMVLAFEVPLYVEGIASFNLEDQFLITADGATSMNRLPRKLGNIG
jgi:Xaa-Pro dipeptidase